MTRTEQIEIYGKCLFDPIYTIEKFFMTFDLTQKGNVPFKLFHKQKEIIHTYESYNRIIVTKPRQAGVSTTTAAYIAAKIAFGDPKNPWKVLILANKQTLAQEFLQKIRDFLDQIPNWVWGIEDGSTYLSTDSKGHIKIKSTKCEVKALATSKDALRGYTPTFLIMDEAAFIDNGSEVFGAALTSLGCITKDSLILTENGLVELDDLVKEKNKIGFTDLDTPHKVCNRYGEIEDSTQTFVSEYGETFKIKTNLGLELEGSWKHPLLVKRDDKDVWVRMNELQVGDKPIIPFNQNYYGNNDYDIKDTDYDYPSNELLKSKKDILVDYIEKLFDGRDYFINSNTKSLRRIQSLLFNMGIISTIDRDMLVRLKFEYDFNNIIIDEITEITKSENHTYDLHVPMTNSFISNGFISHNTGGRVSLISTPNGLDELYYKTYDGAKTGKNNFKIVEMRWHQDIRYNRKLRWLRGEDEEIKCESIGRSKLRWEYNGILYETTETSIENYDVMIKDGWKPSSPWYESMCEDMNGDVRQIAQELDVSFVGSGGNVIDEKFIQHQELNNVKDPEFTAELEKKMWIWKKPEIGHKYILGADVSRGDGKDSSTIVILDFENMEQVAEYQGMIPPDFLAQLIYKYGNMYNAYTIIDITGGMGVSTVLKLQELGYKHLHYDNSRTKILQDKRSIDKYVNVDNKTPGFNVGSNRLHMITELEEHIRENKTLIRSTRLISELKTFVYKNGRPDHMEGYHDDLIMGLAMCIFIVQTSFKNLEKVTQQTKAMLDSWSVSTNSAPTNFMNNNNTSSQFYTNTNNYNQQNIPTNNDPNQDFSWLFGFKK